MNDTIAIRGVLIYHTLSKRDYSNDSSRFTPMHCTKAHVAEPLTLKWHPNAPKSTKNKKKTGVQPHIKQ